MNRVVRLARAHGPLLLVYFFLAYLNLRMKINVTGSWFNGTLEHNHALLLQRQYTNNEQSRVLQFLIPQALIHYFKLDIPHAYILQRLVFTWLAFAAFHQYLRRWFNQGEAVAAVCLLAAVLPFTYMNDLQESSALLMLTFVGSLWALRDGPSWLFALVLLIGAMNNETSLALPVIYLVWHWRGDGLRAAAGSLAKTIAVSLPAFVFTAFIRYLTRDRPHLGGALHWKDNLDGIAQNLRWNSLDYFSAPYLSMFLVFNVLWVMAFLGLRRKPGFIVTSLVVVPAFVIPHLITGIIYEARQMIPLGFALIPAAMCWLLRDDLAARGAGAHRDSRPR